MKAAELLALCDGADWKTTDTRLKQAIRDAADDAGVYALAAHGALRCGNSQIARWFVHKAQGLDPENAAARIEDICIDFYEARFELAHQKLNHVLLNSAEPGHPVYWIAAYLCCMYGDNALYAHIKSRLKGLEPLPQWIERYLAEGEVGEGAWNAVERVTALINRGDKLLAAITARFTEMFFPTEANSFAALGLFNLYAGFYKNADRNFHEAIFRETSHPQTVKLNKFFLLCRQHRYAEAIALGLEIEQAGNLDFTGHGLLLEMMLRSGTPPAAIEERLALLAPHLRQKQEKNPLLEVVKWRLALKTDAITPELLTQEVRPFALRAECPAAYLYLYAELLASTRLPEAKQFATRALALDPLHPDAAHWSDPEKSSALNFEFAGLFIPKEHEGGAWPTPTQLQLLDILFALPQEKLAESWRAFTAEHSLYTLEAGAARLLPFVYKTLERQLPEDAIAEVDLLKGIWKKSYFENALKMKNILGVLELLHSHGIDMVLLKGLANALPLYGDLGSRPMSDIDVLIDSSAIDQVDALLAQHGWHPEYTTGADRTRFSYAITYRHPSAGMLDVHWRPVEFFSSDDFDPKDIGPFESVEFMGKKWSTLNPTTNLFCAILHGVEWNHLSPVRWVVDALLTLQKRGADIDWEEMHRLAIKYHCLPPLAMGLKYLTRYNGEFTKAFPKALLKAVNADYSNDILMTIRLRPRNVLASFEEAWATLEQFKKRFRFNANDYPFIFGGDKPDHIKVECEKRGVPWLPYFDGPKMMALIKQPGVDCNMIVINANLSCSFQCWNFKYS